MIWIAETIPGWEMLVIGVLVMMVAGAVVWIFVARRAPLESEVDRRLANLVSKPGSMGTAESASDLIRTGKESSLFSRLSILSKPLESRTDVERHRLALRLAQAGYRSDRADMVFLSLKMLLMMVGATLGFLLAWWMKWTGMNVFNLTVLGAVAGFQGPNLWLRSASRKRIERISMALPDSLDMLVLAVEAGLGLDAAIRRVADEMKGTFPELSEEWQLAARETQMGVLRAEAMRKMAERTGVSEMRSLVAILLQSEKFGTSIAHSLRVYSDSFRTKRFQRAEEIAAKLPVKLIIPLMLFIMPALFVVLVGPAALSLYHAFIHQ